jgi:ribonuclease HI
MLQNFMPFLPKVSEDWGLAAGAKPEFDPNMAEYSGLIKALEWVREKVRGPRERNPRE